MKESSFLEEYRTLMDNELRDVIKNLQAVPEQRLWTTKGRISNSAGVLAQHLAGNLNYYIGTALGNTGYVRTREAEFQKSDKKRSELIQLLENTRIMTGKVIPNIDSSQLDKPFPLENDPKISTRLTLLKMLKHLSYHNGQLNYLSRILGDE